MKIWYAILLLSLIGYTQNKPVHYNSSNGLPHDITYGLFQDSSGYLWIGTDNGLVKYGGDEFKVFTISDGLRSNYAIDINETIDKKIVVATWGGGIQFMENETILQDSLSDSRFAKINKINFYGEDIIGNSHLNKFYFYTKTGNTCIKENYNFKISKLREIFGLENKLGDDGKRILNPINIRNRLYFIGGNNFGIDGITGIQSIDFKNSSAKEEFPFLKNIKINDLLPENSNFRAISDKEEILFSSKGILKRDTLNITLLKQKNKTLKRFVKTPNYDIYILEDEFHISDNIIISNRSGDEFDFSKEYKINSLVSDIIQDKDHNVWISLYGQGVYFIPYSFELTNTSYSRDNSFQDILETDNGNILLLGLSSIYRIDSLRRTKLYSYKTFFESFNHSISEGNRVSVVASINDEVKSRKKINLEFELEYSKNNVRLFEEFNFKVSYWNKMFTVNFLNSDRFVKYNYSNETHIVDVQLINNELWVATNTGFFIHNIKDFSIKRVISSFEGLSNPSIKSFTTTGHKVYVATINGFTIINQNSISNYSKEDGLPSNNINHIYIDKFGLVWISHQKGYSIFKDDKFYNFTKDNGSEFSYVNKIYEDTRGFIWIIGSNGAKQILNANPFTPDNSPSIQVFKKETQFIFTTIDFSGDKLLTQYKIDDESWITVQQREFDFSNYKYGDHDILFRVKRPSSDWNYSEKFNFSIYPPWYKTTYGQLSILTLLTIVLGYRLWRIYLKNNQLKEAIYNRKVLEKELSEVRQNVASDFHDELGNKLAGITIVSELLLKDKMIVESESHELVKQVQKDADSLYFGIRDFIWSIDSKSDQLDELIIYLSDFGEELFQNSNITFRIVRNLDSKDVKLPNYWSRQLLLLFKETMTNCLKHSKASEVELIFILRENVLTIETKDNGQGFTYETIKRKNGIINMQRRAAKIGGELIIESLNNTRVIFIGHLKN